MKISKILALCAILLCGAFVVSTLPGCQTAQKVVYTTLYSAEKATVSAYDSYLDLVIAGKVPTNDVPTISREFNAFQASMQAAIVAANFNTNAPVSPQLISASQAIIVDIQTAKGK